MQGVAMPSSKIARGDECDSRVHSTRKEQGHQRHSPDWRREGLWEMVATTSRIVNCSEGLKPMDRVRLLMHPGVGDPLLFVPVPTRGDKWPYRSSIIRFVCTKFPAFNR
jgi:hypothetical protein